MTPHNITIIGAGTMGGGIAIGCLAAGLPTTAIDTTEAALDTLRQRVTAHFARQAEKGRITAAKAEAACALLRSSTGLDAASGADLVIEAVFEDLDIKLDLFRRLAPHLSDGAIVATNTSALRVTDLAAAIPDPARFLGLHYFSPAEVNPLVEVVSGPDTTPDTVLAVLAFLDVTGKTALPCRDANGFGVNRFFCPYTTEAARLLDDGLRRFVTTL